MAIFWVTNIISLLCVLLMIGRWHKEVKNSVWLDNNQTKIENLRLAEDPLDDPNPEQLTTASNDIQTTQAE